MARVYLKDVAVSIPVYTPAARLLKSKIISTATGGLVAREARSVNVVHALRGVSFELKDGDRLAVVGRNGAGKSSLLRVIAGIYEPTSGQINVQGRVAALTSSTLGMNYELTGIENIFLRGIVLGFTRSQAKCMVDEVAEFTELGEYLEMPVRTYSAGMVLRLAFAINTAVDPEVLVMDEVIGAGDAHFFAKAKQRLDEVISKASIFVLASHSDHIIRELCNKAVHLDRGQVVALGGVDEILEAYNRDV